MKTCKIHKTIYILTALFLYLPLVTLFIYSFNSGKTGSFQGFSFIWYEKLFQAGSSIGYGLINTIIVLMVTTALSVCMGVAAAIGIYRKYPSFASKYLKFLIYLSLIIPDIIIGVGLLLLFVMLHLHLSLLTVIIGHVTFCIPFVVLIILGRLEALDSKIIEAAQDLGAGEKAILFKIVLPLLKPAIIASILMVITLSIDDFMITFFIAGPGSTTLPLEIYSMIRYGQTEILNALGAVMIVATGIGLLMSKKYLMQGYE